MAGPGRSPGAYQVTKVEKGADCHEGQEPTPSSRSSVKHGGGNIKSGFPI